MHAHTQHTHIDHGFVLYIYSTHMHVHHAFHLVEHHSNML